MRKRVVITGLGAVSPLGNNVADTWDAISNGQSGIAKITAFDASDYTTQIAGEVKDFSAEGVVHKKDLKKMERFIQFALVATKEALDDAKLEISDDIADETGVSIGVGMGGLPNIEASRDKLVEKGPSKITPFFIPMTISNMASGQVSIYFGPRGYNATTTSACSSSNHSIGDAARIIERGDAKVMIVGGTESTICPLAIGGFGAMKALSRRNDDPTKASRPYEANREGFVLSEGSAIMILEEYEYAKARGAKIYAELAGYGFSSDAFHMSKPSTDGPARSMKMAMKDAGVTPDQIDYINTHGTSTPAGDINELDAIKLAFGDAAKKVSISSTKSMHGHLLGAAGALEGVLVVKAMENNLVPPTINIEELDPECDLDVTPNTAKERNISVALSNGFGFGGTNATLVFKSVE